MIPFFARGTLTADITFVDYDSAAVEVGDVNKMIFTVNEYAKYSPGTASVTYTVMTSADMREWANAGSGATLTPGSIDTVTGLSRYVKVRIRVQDTGGVPAFCAVTCQVHGKPVEE
jgi:hypothetical protein